MSQPSAQRDSAADDDDRAADAREIDYQMRQSLADDRDARADARERRADARDTRQDRREADESERQRHADAKAADRDRTADARDRVADERDRIANERDRAADQREIDAETRAEGLPNRSGHASATATFLHMRRRLAAVALDVARVEEDLATTFERVAQRNHSRAGHLRGLAAAARRHAENERLAARRLTEINDEW